MKNKILAFALVVMALLPSCEKYTDITPTGAVILNSTQDYYRLVSFPNRAYVTLNFQYLVDDQWMKESNVIGLNKNINIINFTFDEQTDRVSLLSSSNLYDRAYFYINRWNTIISGIEFTDGEQRIKDLAKAEAKILRAFDHFILVNVYAKAYDPATAATDGGICIMDKYDLEAKPKKSTVEEVYRFIQKDIDEALPFLQENPAGPYHPNVAFGYALKAKVHLFKREIAQAKEAALKSLSYKDEIFDLVDYSRRGGPTSVPVIAPNNPEILSYMYMTGYNEMNFGFNYVISPELRNLFGNNDARFNLFFVNNTASFVDLGTGAAYYNIRFNQFFYGTVGLKTTEVHLMLAECYARENNFTDAIAILNKLRAKRILSGTVNLDVPATRQATMELIVNERRKELLFGFHRFFDLKRLNNEPDYAKTLTRTYPLVSTAVPRQTYTLAPNSRLYIIPFPLNAMKLNPNLRLNTDEKLPF
ncbi:RagB/SusD family nutrient uptake outer membrane protein [Pedobacter aquae]|uniref:RagB/SusD family nutrient uptake outer membrane protein n=1 Tax=Pedobacter aquae TaxID=2605747 RepID=A0A5C0VL37_9SPHI|nr:RagB/SusD family nutrient uptake outer membrane protein [Pedobacter aquae]QEK51890.1 RagB/SusD family nutrient uptake outer membrane protein [Pedobacter aquae]